MHTSLLAAAAPATAFTGPLTGVPIWLIGIAAIWIIVLKGFALWYAARSGQKWWFIAILLINTVGLLEIVYLIWFRPRSFELEVEEEPKDSSPN